jgi:chromosome segregation ATPase
MAETYKVGERYYVPVRVTKVEKASEGDRYPITASFLYTKKKTAFNTFANEPGILLTADEVAGSLKTKADVMEVVSDSLQEENEELRAENERLKADRDEWKKVAANNASFHRDACNERDELKSANDDLKAMVNDLKDRLARFEKKNENQAEKIKGLEEKISDVCAGNQQLRENRDALNNEAALHMTSIHNLQVAVEVLAEKIFEMRCEQDG